MRGDFNGFVWIEFVDVKLLGFSESFFEFLPNGNDVAIFYHFFGELLQEFFLAHGIHIVSKIREIPEFRITLHN